MTIEVDYMVDLPDEVIQPRLFILGNLIAQEMRKLAIVMGLVGEGDYSQGFLVVVKDGVLIIENRTKHAEPLEYGTYEYFQKFGLEQFPSSPDPKKKNLTPKARKRFPKGSQPFAVMRRVLYNKQLMSNLIRKVFS